MKAFKRLFKGLLKAFKRPFKRLLKAFQRPFKGLLKGFQRLFKGFSKALSPYLGPYLGPYLLLFGPLFELLALRFGAEARPLIRPRGPFKAPEGLIWALRALQGP